MSDGRAILDLPVVCLITDRRRVDPGRMPAVISAALRGGVTMVQVREKDLSTRELLDLVLRLRDVVMPPARLLVNGRADVAFAARADGVHLPSDGIPISGARAALGFSALIGRSVHSADEAASEAIDEVDYLEIGTVFPSPSHPDGQTIGVEPIRLATAQSVPVLGVGGISRDNVGPVIEAGAVGVAVISAILGAADAQRAAAELAEAVRRAWESRRPAAVARLRLKPVRLTVNGKAREVETPTTILDFLQRHDVNPALVAVEHNGEIVRRERFSEVALAEGDRLEIIQMVGGGEGGL